MNINMFASKTAFLPRGKYLTEFAATNLHEHT